MAVKSAPARLDTQKDTHKKENLRSVWLLDGQGKTVMQND